MKNYLLYFFIFICLINFETIQSQNEKAKQEYLYHLNIIEGTVYRSETLKGCMEGTNESIVFLESITGIRSNYSYQFEVLISPTKKNIRDWKDWYKKNKKLLYWDEKENKVKVRR